MRIESNKPIYLLVGHNPSEIRWVGRFYYRNLVADKQECQLTTREGVLRAFNPDFVYIEHSVDKKGLSDDTLARDLSNLSHYKPQAFKINKN